MEITLGWWVIPSIITIISFIIANNYDQHVGGYLNIDLQGLVRFTFSLIISLISWLIYALAT